MKRLVPVLVVVVSLLAALAAHAQVTASGHKPTKTEPAAAVLDSITILERAVAKDSSNFENLYRLGVMYMDRDRNTEATKVLVKALTLRPTDVKTMVNVGVVFDAAGQPQMAQQYYDGALKLVPGDSVAMCRKASSIYGMGRYDEAMNVLRQVVRDKPNSYCAYFTMGVAFADAGLYRDAIRMWRKVVDIAPASPEAVSARESIDVLEKFLDSPSQP